MIRYPYSTTALAPQAPKTAIPLLQASIARRDLVALENQPNILEVPVEIRDIKPFFHPITVEAFGGEKLVIDTRSMVRLNRAGERVIQNPNDYANMLVRARLTYLWSTAPDTTVFGQVGDIPARTFTRVITDAISRRLGMPPADFLTLQIVTAFFWYSLFQGDGALSESELISVSNRISRITRIPPNQILQRLEGVSWATNVSAYCDLVRTAIGNGRVDSLNPAMLFTMLGGMWFGVDAANVVRAALEYPPYWIAVCYTAAVDRSFNKSLIGKEVQTANQRNNALGLFAKAVEALLEDSNHV